MRRWVCIVALLTAFGGEAALLSSRPVRAPIPIERPLERLRERDRRALPATSAWYLRS
jgi:hypothetical protein